MATHPSILACRIQDRGAWRATVHTVTKESDTTERLNDNNTIARSLLPAVQLDPAVLVKNTGFQGVRKPRCETPCEPGNLRSGSLPRFSAQYHGDKETPPGPAHCYTRHPPFSFTPANDLPAPCSRSSPWELCIPWTSPWSTVQKHQFCSAQLSLGSGSHIH